MNWFIRIISKSLIYLGIFSTLVFSPIQAESNAAELPPHPLKFYIDSALAEGLTTEQLQSRLLLYAYDINTIFSKQTNRQFEFNPTTDIILVADYPQSDSYNGSPCDMPRTGYEIWIAAMLTEYPEYGTYGGYASIDSSGAGVAAGLYWDAIHDRSILSDSSVELEQYWRQIDHIVHELEHVFGCGYSEYYSLNTVHDSTGIAPTLDIYLSNYPNDPFWSNHSDYVTDPLTNNIWNDDLVGNPVTYIDLMNTVNFANVTVAVLNDTIRGCLDDYLPNLTQTRVTITNSATGNPITDANIKIWDVKSVSAYDAVLIVDDSTSADGTIAFNWDGEFNNFNNLMLIKVYHDNFDPEIKWVSIFDAQYQKIANQTDSFNIDITMTSLSLDVPIEEYIPGNFSLSQNYPNPFNPSTVIAYNLPFKAEVTIDIYNVIGNRVTTLVNETKPAGQYRAVWSGENDLGEKVASGIYFYRISVGEFTATRKMVLLK